MRWYSLMTRVALPVLALSAFAGKVKLHTNGWSTGA